MEKNRKNNDQPLGDIINKLMKAYGIEDKMREFDIINGWEEMMGKAIAVRTEKIYIQNRVLHLKMNSSVMREELMHGKQIIIERVNQKAGAQMVVDVWFE